jgi:hypothetical protein
MPSYFRYSGTPLLLSDSVSEFTEAYEVTMQQHNLVCGNVTMCGKNFHMIINLINVCVFDYLRYLYQLIQYEFEST